MNRMIGAVLVLTFVMSASAQDSIDTRIIIGMESNALLTPTFRKSFRDTFSAGLRSAAEGVARITVVDLAELRPQDRLPAWESAFARGLEKLDRTSLGDAAKTQYVSITVADGKFVIRSRMTDGALGWISPTVQEDHSPDREALPRLALAQVLRDFGLTGKIVASDGDRNATIQLFAGNSADIRLASWVKPGDLFALVKMGGAGQSARVPNVIFRAQREPSNGKVECRVESRFVKPLQGWESGSYRAVKLPAVRGVMRVSLRHPNGMPAVALTVRVSANGFERTDTIKESGTSRDGNFVSNEIYDRIAYARILTGDRLLAQVPVEILRDIAVAIEVRGDAVDPPSVDLDQRLVRGRLNDLLTRISEDDAEVRKELDAGKNPLAFDHVNRMLGRIDDELPRLTTDVGSLRGRNLPGMEEIERSLRDAIESQKSLIALKGRLQSAIAAMNSPEAVRKREELQLLIAKAERAVDEADFDAAIITYEEALKQRSEWPDAAKRLDELKRGWRIVSDAHRAARTQVYEVWAKAQSADDFTKNLDSAKQAFAVCKSVNDRYTPKKIYLVLRRGADVLAKRADELRSSQGEEATKQRDALRQTSAAMSSLLTDVESYLRPKQ